MASVYGTDIAETINAFDGVTNGDDIILSYGGNDTVYGLGGNDILKGGGGADTLIGGSGVDTADYGDSAIGVVVNLQYGYGVYGTADGDTLSGIENISGSVHIDSLVGDAGSNVLTGLDGGDTLYGQGGVDTLYGGTGSDWLDGGAGADTLDGGSGHDEASYYNAPAGVITSIISGGGSGGDAAGDVYISIEDLSGSAFADTLWGDNAVNEIRGWGGNDSLKGLGGNDTLHGQDGIDTLFGGTGADTLNGGEGDDTLEGQDNADFLSGGAGNDTFVFRPGQVGDIVMDFNGNGAGAGDVLRFEGFGPGATLIQLDDWTWQVTYDGGASTELLAFDNAAAIHASDYVFV